MGSFAADSFAVLTTPDELRGDHLKSSADALEVQMFNKPRRGSTSREQPFTSQREGKAEKMRADPPYTLLLLVAIVFFLMAIEMVSQEIIIRVI